MLSAHRVGQRSIKYFAVLEFLTDSKGSLLFCPTCGTLLSLPRDGESVIACEQCGREESASCEEWFLNQ